MVGAKGRAGLNERKAPGKVVTARPIKRIAQIRSVSHALVPTLQKHRSKTWKLIRFGSLHFRPLATGEVLGQFPHKFFVPPKYCCAHKKSCPLKMYFAPSNHKTWLRVCYICWTSKIILNSTQLRKRPLFSTVWNHETQVYAKGNFSIWKSRVQLVFHNTYMHSQFCTFSVTMIKISFLLVQNGVMVRICFFLVCNLGLFEITEWEPCTWLLNTDILAGNAVRQWHCW